MAKPNVLSDLGHIFKIKVLYLSLCWQILMSTNPEIVLCNDLTLTSTFHDLQILVQGHSSIAASDSTFPLIPNGHGNEILGLLCSSQPVDLSSTPYDLQRSLQGRSKVKLIHRIPQIPQSQNTTNRVHVTCVAMQMKI